MDPLAVIARYYQADSRACRILVDHSRQVTEKARRAAERLAGVDRDFIAEAAMLHDIGIFRTRAPGLDCHGDHPYLCHGFLGREILEAEGFPRHALVCERHVGTGISREEIVEGGLPLPARDMVPVSLEEQVICYADKFFSKLSSREKTPEEIRQGLSRWGAEKVAVFEGWLERFG